MSYSSISRHMLTWYMAFHILTHFQFISTQVAGLILWPNLNHSFSTLVGGEASSIMKILLAAFIFCTLGIHLTVAVIFYISILQILQMLCEQYLLVIYYPNCVSEQSNCFIAPISIRGWQHNTSFMRSFVPRSLERFWMRNQINWNMFELWLDSILAKGFTLLLL